MNTRIIQKTFVINADGKFLALRRSETDIRRPNQWDIPGGHLDEGETLEEGVMREIREEAQLEVRAARVVFAKTEIREWLDPAQGAQQENCVFLFYIAQAPNQDVVISHEHSEYAWFSFDEGLQNFEYALHKEVMQHITKNQLVR